MANTLIDLYNKIIKYNEKTVYIAFHSITNDPYFHATQVCKLLGYVNCHQALHTNISKNRIMKLKDIVSNYKSLYKNVQGHTTLFKIIINNIVKCNLITFN